MHVPVLSSATVHSTELCHNTIHEHAQTHTHYEQTASHRLQTSTEQADVTCKTCKIASIEVRVTVAAAESVQLTRPADTILAIVDCFWAW